MKKKWPSNKNKWTSKWIQWTENGAQMKCVVQCNVNWNTIRACVKKTELSVQKRKTWISIRHFRVVYVCRSFCSPFEYIISVVCVCFFPSCWYCCCCFGSLHTFGYARYCFEMCIILTSCFLHFWFQFSVFLKEKVLINCAIELHSTYKSNIKQYSICVCVFRVNTFFVVF